VLGLAIVGLVLIVAGSFFGLYSPGFWLSMLGWVVAAVGVGLVAVAVARWVRARR
jgi:hypothetical protein